jgi:hypothetical protein
MKWNPVRDLRLMMEGQAVLLALMWFQGVPSVWQPEKGLFWSIVVIALLLAAQFFLSTRISVKLSGGTP